MWDSESRLSGGEGEGSGNWMRERQKGYEEVLAEYLNLTESPET